MDFAFGFCVGEFFWERGGLAFWITLDSLDHGVALAKLSLVHCDVLRKSYLSTSVAQNSARDSFISSL